MSAHWWSGNEEQGLTGQFRVFAQAVLAGSRTTREPEDVGPLAAGPEDGLRALELLEAMKESAATGQAVSVPVRRVEVDRTMPSALH